MFSSITVFPVIAFALWMFFSKDKLAERVLFSIFASLGTALIMVVISGLIEARTPGTFSIVEYDKVKIVALSTAASTTGSFFLGTGRIEGQPYYHFYFETSDGGKKLMKLSADHGTLYEEDRKDAYMVKVRREKRLNDHGPIFNFFVPVAIRDENDDLYGYAIHIPKGSIKEEINLSLPK